MIKVEDYYNMIITFKKNMKTELPVISISIFLFLTLWIFFGKYNMILPPFLTLYFKVKYQQEFKIRELIKNYLMILTIAFMSFLAGESLIFCILINLAVPFFIVYFLTNKFTPKSYFVYGMAFVFMQLMPISSSLLPMRIVALLYSFIVLTVALFFSSKYLKKEKKYDKLREKILLLSQQIRKLTLGESIEDEKLEVIKSISNLNQQIYFTRNSRYLATEYGKTLYLFMIFFQRVNYYMEECVEREKKLDEQFFLSLSDLLEKIGKNIKIDSNRDLVMEIEKFQRDNRERIEEEGERLESILNLLKIALLGINLKDHNRNEREWKIPLEENKVKNFHKAFEIDIFQIRFALRLSVVLCISFTFVFISKLEHSYWVPMSAFLMLMPYAEESKQKITNRILGTIFGIITCWILMSIYHGITYRIIIVIFMTIFMYTVPITSWTMTIYTTCYGMTLATITLGMEEAIILRLIYVAVAVIITWIANYYIFPNTAIREFKNSIKELFQVDRKMIVELKKGYENRGNINNFRHLLLEANMLSDEIRNYISKGIDENERRFYTQMLLINQTLIIEMEQLNSYLYFGRKRFEVKEKLEIRELFQSLEKALDRVYIGYVFNKLEDFTREKTKVKESENSGTKLYFDELFSNCIDSVKELEMLRKITE